MFPLVDGALELPTSELSSITFIAYNFNCAENKKICVKDCIFSIKEKLKDYSTWLLASTSWQEDTSRARYYGLWKGLSIHAGNQVLSWPDRFEEAVYGPEGLRFFGAARIDADSIALALSLIDPYTWNSGRSFLVLMPEMHRGNLYEYIEKGWMVTSKDHAGLSAFWTAMISCTCRNNGIFLRIFGEFDDRESGVNAIMPRTLFEQYLHHV